MPPSCHRASLAALFMAMAVFGCSTKAPRQVVDTICLSTTGLNATEIQYVQRRAAEYLTEYSMRVVPAACDATATFTFLGSTSGTSTSQFLPIFGTSTFVGVDGTLTITRGSEVLVEHVAVNLRRYASANELLDGLAWAMVGPVARAYRATSVPK